MLFPFFPHAFKKKKKIRSWRISEILNYMISSLWCHLACSSIILIFCKLKESSLTWMLFIIIWEEHFLEDSVYFLFHHIKRTYILLVIPTFNDAAIYQWIRLAWANPYKVLHQTWIQWFHLIVDYFVVMMFFRVCKMVTFNCIISVVCTIKNFFHKELFVATNGQLQNIIYIRKREKMQYFYLSIFRIRYSLLRSK